MRPDWVDWRWNLRSMLVMTTLTSPLMHTPCTVAATERKTRNHLGLLNRLRKGRGRQQEAQSATTTEESTNAVGEVFDLDPGVCSSREPEVGGGPSSSFCMEKSLIQSLGCQDGACVCSYFQKGATGCLLIRNSPVSKG